jgi:ribosomal protein S18 acetylase RimI-like enzyme
LETRLGAGLSWNLSAAEVRQVLPRPTTEAERNGSTWEDAAGNLVGFGLVWPPWDSVYVLIHPDYDPEGGADGAESALLDQIVGWTVAHGAEIARVRGQPVTLHARPSDRDAGLVAVLERHGFGREDWHTLKYGRMLAGPLPAPKLPLGFAIRPVGGEQEVDAYVALHRAAFGTQHMQAEERRALMHDPAYMPELDLVAVAPDGTLAAFAGGGIDCEASRYAGHVIGYTDPIGTRPAYRRLGLARALLREAFLRLQQHGVQVTTVGTGSWNVPTMGLLESAGYRLDYRILAYAKTTS